MSDSTIRNERNSGKCKGVVRISDRVIKVKIVLEDKVLNIVSE